MGPINPSAPVGLPCYERSMPPVTIYPRALFMPNDLMAVAGQSKTTRTWDPQTGKWTFAGNLSVARSNGNMVMLLLNTTVLKKDRYLFVEETTLPQKRNHRCPTFDA